MAAGRAIVASRIGQVADILRDEETALLAEPGSITNLVEKIRRLRMEPGFRLSLGRSAKAEAFRKHGWSNRVQDLIDAIGISGAEAGRGSASPRTAAGASMGRDLIASLGIYMQSRLAQQSGRFSTVTGKGFRPRAMDLGGWRYVNRIQ